MKHKVYRFLVCYEKTQWLGVVWAYGIKDAMAKLPEEFGQWEIYSSYFQNMDRITLEKTRELDEGELHDFREGRHSLYHNPYITPSKIDKGKIATVVRRHKEYEWIEADDIRDAYIIMDRYSKRISYLIVLKNEVKIEDEAYLVIGDKWL